MKSFQKAAAVVADARGCILVQSHRQMNIGPATFGTLLNADDAVHLTPEAANSLELVAWLDALRANSPNMPV